MQVATGGHYRVECVDDGAGLAALRQPWEQLLDEAPQASVLLSWEWVSAWWEHHEPGWELWLLTSCDDSGRLAGILPLALKHHCYGPLRLRRLAFAGDHLAYRIHLDVLARPEDRVAVTDAFLGYLLRDRRSQWDVLDLEAIAEGSHLDAALALHGGRRHFVANYLCPYVSLPVDWAAFEREHLSNDHRKWLRNRSNRLERDYPGQVVYERVKSEARLGLAMDALAELHRRRWHGKGQGSSFDHGSYAGFHRSLAALALKRDWLRLYVLWVAGEPVAAEYAFLYRGSLFDYAKAFDPAWSRYSPGQLLMAHMLRDAIAEGVAEFDMGRGTFDYKFRWGDRSRNDRHVQVSRTLVGHAWAYGGAVYRGVLRLARQHVPADLRERLNRRGARRAAKAPADDAET